MFVRWLIGKWRVSSPRGAFVVFTIVRPSAFVGTEHATA